MESKSVFQAKTQVKNVSIELLPCLRIQNAMVLIKWLNLFYEDAHHSQRVALPILESC